MFKKSKYLMFQMAKNKLPAWIEEEKKQANISCINTSNSKPRFHFAHNIKWDGTEFLNFS